MEKFFGLNLPDWGPYNKIYLGAAHIADKTMGLRFDLNLFPGYFRRSVIPVRDIIDSGTKIIGSSEKLTRFIYRYEVEWKDKVYIDADYRSENNVLTVTCNFVNNTDQPESLSLNAVMSMKCCTAYHKEIVPSVVNVKDGLWVDALDYTNIKTSHKIAKDGLYLCEARESGFVGGSFISSDFFGNYGDLLEYKLSSTKCDKIGIRYRGEGKVVLKTDRYEYEFFLPYSEKIDVYYVAVNNECITSLYVYPQNCKVDFDGFILGGNACFSDITNYFVPECEETEDGVKLCFGDKKYIVKNDHNNFVVRYLKTDDVGQLLTSFIHNHVDNQLGEKGHDYVDLFIRPVFVEANSQKTITITITAPEGKKFPCEENIVQPLCNPSGEKYKLSQKLMSAVTLTNVVWPVYSRRSYILHNTPGRNWDSLYTWDSGFIGMGLSELNVDRAIDCLNAYMTPVGDIHSPYIFHGSPVPTQIFLYAEIFSKTGDVEFLKKFYPMICQQYRFFANIRKNTDAKKHGLFSLWNIFYNSGGWDDYPPQVYVHNNKLEDEVCPVINTAMTVLCGKILKILAEIIGEDSSEFDEDIAFYSDAINKYAWDEESGYYGYVQNDGSIMKIDGVNGDMGMDGAFPFIAGISNNERSNRIIENIKTGMVTPIGVSVVDQRAPYYKTDGYWNGSVWMPHQWILWKACLDNGESEFAEQIAKTALEIWEKETSQTYNCYEHFMITNGRGAGFHQFSGLSTPVLMWFSTYYKPYTVTSGFMTTITNKLVKENHFEFHIKSVAKKPVVLVCMPEGEEYKVKTSGKVSIHNGVCTIEFNGPIEEKITVCNH